MLRRPLNTLLHIVAIAVALVRVLGVPLFCSLIAGAVLAFPEQTHEYYRVLFENILMGSRRHYGEAAIGIVGTLSMAAAIAFSARLLQIDHKRQTDGPTAPLARALEWAPIVLGVVPIMALAYGLSSAADIGSDIDRNQIERELRAFGDATFTAPILSLFEWVARYQPTLRQASIVAFGLAVAFALVAILLMTLTRAGQGFHDFSCRPYSAAVSVLAVAAIVTSVIAWQVELPQRVGVLGIFAAFICVLTMLAAQMRIWGRLSGIPFIGILIVTALGLSALDLNDNHELRRVDRHGAPPPQRNASDLKPATLPHVEESFIEWYRSRPDRDLFEREGKRYPIYIVAAQGGGIYAAAQALLFLTKMQATCHRFSQHLFAISAVSGGAVGAALYSALADSFPATDEQCESWETHSRGMSPSMRAAYLASTELMRRDYLSPLVASALFPDFIQRFLPMTRQEWSRERALEKALEESWSAVRGKAPGASPHAGALLKLGVLGSWRASGIRPAVLYNTTETGSGRRRVIAPFTFGDSAGNDLRFLPLAADWDVPISTSAIASARFPWLTPAAWFWEIGAKSLPQKIRVVDGGYFENSGVSTAMDLIAELDRIIIQHKLPVDVHLIAMTSGGFATQTFFGFGELFAPIQSLLNARQARNYAMIDLSDRQLGPIMQDTGSGTRTALALRRLQRVELKSFVTPLPLGWRLSMASVFQIDRMTGLIGHCVPNERFEQIAKMRAFTSADCVKQVIHHQLRGDDLVASLEAARRRSKDTR